VVSHKASKWERAERIERWSEEQDGGGGGQRKTKGQTEAIWCRIGMEWGGGGIEDGDRGGG
jgi:hypothetical protein